MMTCRKNLENKDLVMLKPATFKQSGLALPLTLILLLVMTLIGIATLRSTTMEENMTANSRLRQVAFNAAETTLREAEVTVENLAGQRRRALFFGADKTRPIDTQINSGDTCTDGYCTPAQFTSPASPAPQGERWEDPTLDVWNNPDRHFEYSNFMDNELARNGVLEPPKYIIEFLGNFNYRELNVNLASQPNIRPKYDDDFVSSCEMANGLPKPPNDTWPYCPSDSGVYRVTVRATAGPPARQAVVTLQSTIRVP